MTQPPSFAVVSGVEVRGEAQSINPESMLRPTLTAVSAGCRPQPESPGSLGASPDVASGPTSSTMDGMIRRRSIVASLTAIATGLVLVAAPASGAAPSERSPQVTWTVCPDDIPNLPVDPVVQCGKLRVPVDWSNPRGATFDLAVARRPARKPAERVGTLVFGPGGPGDSGVERIRRGNRFSAEILDRFDTVSFDPRGVARSGSAACPSSPGLPPPPGLLASQADFDATIAYNRAMWAACRATSPVWEHADTLSTVRDLDALRSALGLQKLTFHGSSYGTLLGEQYAERYPGRVRAIVLESVFDHSLDVRDFVRTQALALQDAFDEFVAWCAASIDCALHGSDVRAVWNDVLDRADKGEYAPNTAFELAILPIARLAAPDRVGLSNDIAALRDGKAPRITLPPLVSSVFCADWPAGVRDYQAYASLVRDAAAVAPDVRYGGGLLAIRACLGWPAPVANPPHRLHVRTTTPLLLLNSVHDVRTGYLWATNVASQLGRHGRLVTYEGSGHGAYGNTPCTTAVIDRYLIDLIVPPPGARCPAAEA
jgi:pimeloyl-ACP methyl ester carboxylesterase